MAIAPKIFSIPSGAPFLPTLREALLSGKFGPLDLADPLSLAGVTILLPTRRAVRALTDLFAERAGGNIILPRIATIGDIEESEFLFEPPLVSGEDLLTLPEAVGSLDRRLELARLVLAWGRSLRADERGLPADEPLLIPASPADAIRLAGDLAQLIDEMASNGISWAGFAGLGGEDYPLYWQLTLEFLKIASQYWPERLAELGLVDGASWRDRLIRAEAKRLAANPPKEIFIAAGSTGSVPATGELLSVIAQLPQGAVVLPGLDRELEEDAFQSIIGETPSPGHPQYGLRQLLSRLRLARSDVTQLGDPSAAARARTRLLSQALRPARTSDAWAGIGAIDREALDGVALLVARNEAEEALAIALVLRQAVEEGKSAALVTPDRAIARRVAAELRRFQLEVDDSAGMELAATAPANFARLVIEAAVSNGEAAKLLAVLKHPLAAFGMDRRECRAAARLIELACFRGAHPANGLATLPDALAKAWKPTSESGHRAGPLPAETERRLAYRLAENLVAALKDLTALSRKATSFGETTKALLGALRLAGADETGSDALLWSGKAGEGLASLLMETIAAKGSFELALAEYPAFLGALMEGVKIPGAPTAYPRIHIWGTLEARLQSVDRLILAGLDEGVWPAASRTDPFLSRQMRAALGLEAPERRIGQAAHDFAQAMGAPSVLLSRALKRGGTPQIASRWLQRLAAVIGEDNSKQMTAAGDEWIVLARRLDFVPPAEVQPAPRAAYSPPVAARPRRLSVTEIETLIRDPYAIYAKHVLRLLPLEDLARPPDAALRGTLIHQALADFTAHWQGGFGEAGEKELLALIEKGLESLAGFPAIQTLWRFRGAAIAHWFVGWERGREGILERGTEISGEMEIAVPAGVFHLRGRADRIDLRCDGGVEIFDFKTGQPPTPRQVLSGLSPQLGLEAMMLAAGAFGKKFAARPIEVLAWIALSRAGKGKEIRSAIDKDSSALALEDAALAQLRALIGAYDNGERPYRSLERPMWEKNWRGDYDHLARLREWRLAGAEEEE